MKTLVIVESPTKAKTISRFLGSNYIIKSSFGHVRDLPKSKLSIDIEHDFAPKYIVSKDKTKVVKEFKEAAKKADEVILASDEDREGEAIAWHLSEILDLKKKELKRITFHEITKHALEEAMKHPRELDMNLVDAQQARRVLDRLVGYELSPFLWRKVAKGLSAGRVQSVAVRLIVEREREIKAFNTEEYWSLEGVFSKEKNIFNAKLHSVANKKLDKMDLKNAEQVNKIIADLEKQKYTIKDLEKKQTKRNPLPPFTTSTLQQEANNALGFSAKQTMMLAQKLYEGIEIGNEGHVGLITYMRTDAVNLSEKFLNESREVIEKEFGKKYSLSAPRFYKNKNKNAQEAHEAIRPTDAFRTPKSVEPYLDRNQYRLYDLIWRRAVATQMAEAELNSVSMDVVSENNYLFRATGQTIIFDGFLKLFPEKTKENTLPELVIGDKVNCEELKPEQHFTEPPARYSDATLVKAMEEYGIGRPSTYAPTIATIESRGYVERDEKKRLAPTDIAFLVNDVLVEHFAQIVDYKFTAEMEESLDEIAEGAKKWPPVIRAFYTPFKENLTIKDKELVKKDIVEMETKEVCEKCGKPMVIKTSRYGKFLACTGYPECKNTKNIGRDGKVEEKTPEEITGEKCEKCGGDMIKKVGRFGPFMACANYPKCKNIKNIDQKIDMKCPKCGTGDIVQKRSKRGKIFFGCSKYPDCDFALWDKPTGKFCEKCKAPMITDRKGIEKCSNKECN